MQPSEGECRLLEQLIEVGRRCVEQGLTLASGGNLSAREPGSGRFLVTGKGTWLDRLTVDSFALVSESGERLWGPLEPSSEVKLHQRTYQARTDAAAIVHTHPQHVLLLDSLDRPIRFLTLDHAFYVGSVGRVAFFPNGSDELADGAAQQALEHNTVVLAHHGCSSIGDTVGMAFRRAALVEEAATMTYRALLLGDEASTFAVDEAGGPTHA